MADVLDYSQTTTPARTDAVYVITDPGGTPGDAWSQIGNLRAALGIVVKRKTADESLNTNTTLQDDDELFFAAAANEIWVVDYVLFVDGATGGDIKVAVDAPAGATIRAGVTANAAATATNIESTSTSVAGGSAVGYTAGTLGSGTGTTVRLSASVAMSSTAGDIKLRWAQGTSSGTNSRVLTGSYLIGHLVY
jgi:hypothetical protein